MCFLTVVFSSLQMNDELLVLLNTVNWKAKLNRKDIVCLPYLLKHSFMSFKRKTLEGTQQYVNSLFIARTACFLQAPLY